MGTTGSLQAVIAGTHWSTAAVLAGKQWVRQGQASGAAQTRKAAQHLRKQIGQYILHTYTHGQTLTVSGELALNTLVSTYRHK